MFLGSLATKPDLSLKLLRITRPAFLRFTSISIQQAPHDSATSLSTLRKKKTTQAPQNQSLAFRFPQREKNSPQNIQNQKTPHQTKQKNPSTIGFFLNMKLLAHLAFWLAKTNLVIDQAVTPLHFSGCN